MVKVTAIRGSGLILTFCLGTGLSGACAEEREFTASMSSSCTPGYQGEVRTCREICAELGRGCVTSDEWEVCPADAWGLDVVQCEENLEGDPLDVECGDPLPYFETYRCCCKYEVL